ncbi:MAG: DUF2784 domain-containing protein [Planctomycetota bacterium]|jgi:hypothetical protein
MGYALLADLLVLVHLLIVCFVIGGLVAIVVGAVRHWGWVRHPVFRLCHVAAIVVVATNAVAGVLCPLTEWEYALRDRAGQVYESDISFMGRVVRSVLFYEAPPWAFTVAYVLFALVVIATLIFVPPRWPWSRPPGADD